FYHFFFQAEDDIREYKVTGVQTCALPISRQRDEGHRHRRTASKLPHPTPHPPHPGKGRTNAGRKETNGTATQRALPDRSQKEDRSEERRVGKEGRSRWTP